jgi:hypothetical protein
MRFVNDDVKLKNGGRNAAKISEEELWKKIVARAQSVGDDCEDEEDDGYDGENAWRFVQNLMWCDPIIKKDIKFNVDRENVLTPEDGYDEYLGMHTLPNGLTYYGIIMGGDWEIPMFMIIYWDGKKLRCYIPSYGNLVNLDFGCAFGSEEDSLDDEDKKAKLIKKYAKYGEIPDEDDFDFQTWSDLYCRMYDETRDGCEYNYNAMIEDITSRIIVS